MLNAKAGCLIVLDGPNCTGKSLARTNVAKLLRQEGHDVVETREPGGTPLAEKIRSLILDSTNEMDTVTQVLLFNAARRSHIKQVIEPNVAAGRIVLCDRFLSSSLVFQSLNPDGTAGLDDQFILNAHAMFCDNLKPDLGIYLDAPAEVRQQRLLQRSSSGGERDRFEEYELEYDEAVASKFRKVGAVVDRIYAIIDADRDPLIVASDIFERIKALVDEAE